MTTEYLEFLPFLHHHKRFVRRQQKKGYFKFKLCLGWKNEAKKKALHLLLAVVAD